MMVGTFMELLLLHGLIFCHFKWLLGLIQWDMINVIQRIYNRSLGQKILEIPNL